MNNGDNRPGPIRKAPTSGEVVSRNKLARRDDDDGPSARDLEQFGDVTRTCPSCNKEVFDDAEVCYHCGHAMDRKADAKHSDFKSIVVILVIVGLLIGLIGFIKLW
jgi:uncharacterized protein (DUF983 family)